MVMGMPKAFTDNEREQISEQLHRAGETYFAAHGLKKTTVDELAGAAGISKGAFYLFYASKEALFMDVVERAETQFRRDVLAVIDQPGETPHARLFAVFRQAFTLWRTIPLLQVFTHEDFNVLARKIPAGKLEEHFASDRLFVTELVERCQCAGIPVTAPVETLDGLLHALFFTSLHEEDFASVFPGTLDILIDLLAAYALGEISTRPFIES